MKKNNDFHILFASRLVIEKGVDILIAAIEQSLVLSDFPRKIIWNIVSDGIYESDIYRLQEKYPSQVRYHGKVSPQKMAEFYRKSDLLFMPSRFLETFGLTALESLFCGTPVCGFRKGGLIPFISLSYALDPSSPVDSLLTLLRKICFHEKNLEDIQLDSYKADIWAKNIKNLIPPGTSVFIVHDYTERIGGAEYYVDSLIEFLKKSGNPVSRFSSVGKMSLWKRRWMFIVSLFAFSRGIALRNMLIQERPEIIWMHSILRYTGYWGVRAATLYARETGAKILLSHHDVGLIAPFPQDISEESQIPNTPLLSDFIRGLPLLKKMIAFGKWFYIRLIRNTLPENTEHIIFSSFLEKHIRNHFPKHSVRVIAHSVDESIFHP